MGDPDSQSEINEELLKQVEAIGVEIELIKQMLDRFTQIDVNNAEMFNKLQKITKIHQRHLQLVDEALFPNMKGENNET